MMQLLIFDLVIYCHSLVSSSTWHMIFSFLYLVTSSDLSLVLSKNENNCFTLISLPSCSPKNTKNKNENNLKTWSFSNVSSDGQNNGSVGNNNQTRTLFSFIFTFSLISNLFKTFLKIMTESLRSHFPRGATTSDVADPEHIIRAIQHSMAYKTRRVPDKKASEPRKEGSDDEITMKTGKSRRVRKALSGGPRRCRKGDSGERQRHQLRNAVISISFLIEISLAAMMIPGADDEKINGITAWLQWSWQWLTREYRKN